MLFTERALIETQPCQTFTEKNHNEVEDKEIDTGTLSDKSLTHFSIMDGF